MLEPVTPETLTIDCLSYTISIPFYNLYTEVMASHADEDNAHKEAKKFSIKIIQFILDNK